MPNAYDTWMSIETPYGLLAGEDDVLASAVERGLRAMSRLIRGLRIVLRAPAIPRMRLEDLDYLVFWRALSETAGATEWAMWSLNSRMSAPVPDLTDEDEDRLNGVVDLQGQAHPFTKHRELHDEAMHRWSRGDVGAAVVALQTSIESELFRVCFMLRLDEGATSEELDRWLAKDWYFKSIVTKDLPGRLGGAWDVTDTESPVGRYWRDLYQLRNRMVHSGLEPSYGQTVSAFNACDGLQSHLIDRLYTNARRYPRTLLTLVGVEGLERRGWMTSFLRQWVTENEPQGQRLWWPLDLRSDGD